MKNDRQKVIIDTDIGDDIDDAFALAFAIHSPGLEVTGVTTVFRNSLLRGRLAKALLTSYGEQDIPVCAGMDVPLIQKSIDRKNDRFDANGQLIPCQYDEESMGNYEPDEERYLTFFRDRVFQ